MVISPLPLFAISGWLRLTACQNVQVRDNVWDELAMLHSNILVYSSSERQYQGCSYPCCYKYWYLSFHLPDFSAFLYQVSSVCTVMGSSMDTFVKIGQERQNMSHVSVQKLDGNNVTSQQKCFRSPRPVSVTVNLPASCNSCWVPENLFMLSSHQKV